MVIFAKNIIFFVHPGTSFLCSELLVFLCCYISGEYAFLCKAHSLWLCWVKCNSGVVVVVVVTLFLRNCFLNVNDFVLIIFIFIVNDCRAFSMTGTQCNKGV